MIIAIETATSVCSVAAGKNGKTILEKRVEGKGVHSTYTFSFLKEILERYQYRVEDLEAILFSNGPGSYTGLRIGAGTVAEQDSLQDRKSTRLNSSHVALSYEFFWLNKILNTTA